MSLGGAQPSEADQDDDQTVGADSRLQGQQWTTDQQYLHGAAHQEGAATVLPDHQETYGSQED